MHLTQREIWTALHGMVFGAGFLLLFSGGFLALWILRSDCLTEIGLRAHLRRLSIGSWLIAILAWLAVLVGTYWSYPWYRAKPPVPGLPQAALVGYPKFYLMANEHTADWHEFGMEWKEHIAWLSPILLTAIAFIITAHGRTLASDAQLRQAVLMLFTAAFFCAGVAGLFGALVNKAAPVR